MEAWIPTGGDFLPGRSLAALHCGLCCRQLSPRSCAAAHCARLHSIVRAHCGSDNGLSLCTHRGEREEMEGEAAREGGERWEGREGGRGEREGEANCMCRERKRILKKGKGGADRDNEKGKRREQKASAIRRGRRMRNACAGGRCVGCVRRGACVCVCATACMRVSVLAGRRLEGRRRSALRQ